MSWCLRRTRDAREERDSPSTNLKQFLRSRSRFAINEASPDRPLARTVQQLSFAVDCGCSPQVSATRYISSLTRAGNNNPSDAALFGAPHFRILDQASSKAADTCEYYSTDAYTRSSQMRTSYLVHTPSYHENDLCLRYSRHQYFLPAPRLNIPANQWKTGATSVIQTALHQIYLKNSPLLLCYLSRCF